MFPVHFPGKKKKFFYLVPQCSTLCKPMDCSPPGSSVHGDSPGKNTRVGCHVLLQGIFPTQGLNPSLPHCRRILYHLSQQGSPRILEWGAYPFSMGSFWPRNRTSISGIAGEFFTRLATRKALYRYIYAYVYIIYKIYVGIYIYVCVSLCMCKVHLKMHLK